MERSNQPPKTECCREQGQVAEATEASEPNDLLEAYTGNLTGRKQDSHPAKAIQPRDGTGTPQGGSISPVLANVYLHYVLDLWFEHKVRKSNQGQSYLIRYADDFVCGFAYRHEAQRFLGQLQKRLNKFGLEVAPDKTQMLRFGRGGGP